MLSSRSSSSLVRAWLLRRSVLPYATRTAYLKSVLSLETKSFVSSNPTVRFYNLTSPYTHTPMFFFALPPISFFDSQFLLCTYLLFGDRTWPIHPWGPLAPHQKGGCRSQASWSQSQGQGLEVSSYFDRVKNSQACEILQDKPEACSHFQVWCSYCFDTHCLILWYILSLLEPLKVVMSVMVYFTYVSC